MAEIETTDPEAPRCGEPETVPVPPVRGEIWEGGPCPAGDVCINRDGDCLHCAEACDGDNDCDKGERTATAAPEDPQAALAGVEARAAGLRASGALVPPVVEWELRARRAEGALYDADRRWSTALAAVCGVAPPGSSGADLRLATVAMVSAEVERLTRERDAARVALGATEDRLSDAIDLIEDHDVGWSPDEMVAWVARADAWLDGAPVVGVRLAAARRMAGQQWERALRAERELRVWQRGAHNCAEDWIEDRLRLQSELAEVRAKVADLRAPTSLLFSHRQELARMLRCEDAGHAIVAAVERLVRTRDAARRMAGEQWARALKAEEEIGGLASDLDTAWGRLTEIGRALGVVDDTGHGILDAELAGVVREISATLHTVEGLLIPDELPLAGVARRRMAEGDKALAEVAAHRQRRSGACSAHRDGEDPQCPRCYPPAATAGWQERAEKAETERDSLRSQVAEMVRERDGLLATGTRLRAEVERMTWECDQTQAEIKALRAHWDELAHARDDWRTKANRLQANDARQAEAAGPEIRRLNNRIGELETERDAALSAHKCSSEALQRVIDAIPAEWLDGETPEGAIADMLRRVEESWDTKDVDLARKMLADAAGLDPGLHIVTIARNAAGRLTTAQLERDAARAEVANLRATLEGLNDRFTAALHERDEAVADRTAAQQALAEARAESDHPAGSRLRADGETHEVRPDDDGTLDEIVGHGPYHLEDMGDHWSLHLGPVVISVHDPVAVEGLPPGVRLPAVAASEINPATLTAVNLYQIIDWYYAREADLRRRAKEQA